MRRPELKVSGGPSPLAQGDPDAWKDWPAIRSFFLDTVYDDAKTERSPGGVIITPTTTHWVATLKDNTACTQLRVQSPTWDELLLLVESLLEDNKAPWVVDEWAKRKRGGGRK